MRAGLVPLTLGALLALLCACAPEEAGRWIALEQGTRGGTLAGGAAGLRLEPGGEALWIEHPLPRAAWRAGERAGTWIARRPDGVGFLKSAEELTLGNAATRFPLQAEVATPLDLPSLAAGRFAAVGEQLHLCLTAGTAPPEELVFAVRKLRGLGARPALADWTGAGFTLLPGERMSFRLPRARVASLRFYWGSEALASDDGAEPAWLRVSLDGRELARREQALSGRERGAWHALPLPAGASAGAELSFELGGAPSLAIVLAPLLAPERSARPRAPNLVLFLADTFRADNLACAGGAAELAPELNRLAADSLRFVAARSPSTWTLPAQGSMLSGVYPEQHGATTLGHGLGDEILTLPEWLARHGYRTGAVTDSAFVSRHYGFDQGFEWFREFRSWNLQETLRAAREFLAADDGRPTFLFVHTFRTHMPYRTGPEEDRKPLEALVRELRAGSASHGGDGSIPLAAAAARLQALYHEGVRDLDRQFGSWWRGLEELALGPTFLAFTSDHGEAFYEHEELGHGGSPWEEKIRIPLLLHGPGLAPRAIEHGASLVDLPPTFCALAGIPALAHAEGRDLVTLAEDRIGYSFVRIGPQPMVALLDGTRKIYAPAEPERLAAGEVRGGTDLARDPDERLNLAESEAWPAELARAQAGAMERLVRALTDPQRVELSPEDRAFLDAIGYGGE